MGKYKGVCLYDSENATGTTGKVFVHRRVIDFAWHPLGSRSQWKAITEIVEGSTSTSVGDEGIVNDPELLIGQADIGDWFKMIRRSPYNDELTFATDRIFLGGPCPTLPTADQVRAALIASGLSGQ